MLTPERVLSRFNERIAEYVHDTREFRQEQSAHFRIYDGHPDAFSSGTSREAFFLNKTVHESDGFDEQRRRKRVIPVVNVTAPFLRAIAGMVAVDAPIPGAYSLDDEHDAQSDIMDDMLGYHYDVSGMETGIYEVILDSIVSGLAGGVTGLDMTSKSALLGRPFFEAKQFLFYDRSQLGKVGQRGLAWAGYADPMKMESLEEYVEDAGGYQHRSGASVCTQELLEHYEGVDQADVTFLHSYHWREKQKIYKVENIFKKYPEMLLEISEAEPDAFNHLSEVTEQLQIDMRSSVWGFDPEQYKQFQGAIKTVEFMMGGELEAPEVETESGWCYYRAEIAHGGIIKMGRSFTQECHAVNILPCYYDRALGYNYGLGRAASQLQALINEAYQDLRSYASASATGGIVGITGADVHQRSVIEGILNRKQAIILPEGATINSLGSTDAAQVMAAEVDRLTASVSKALGVTDEILAALSTKDHGSELFSQIMQQIRVSLYHLVNGVNGFVVRQGMIFRDLSLEIAKTGAEIVLPRVSPGHDKSEYFTFSKQNIAKQYAIRAVKKPPRDDERQQEFRLLSEAAERLPDAQRIVLTAEALQLSRLDETQKQRLLQVMQPPQPDPMEMELVMRERAANIRLIEAQALQLENQARMEGAMGAVSERKAVVEIDKTLSEIAENNAQAMKYQADAARTVVSG